MAKFREKFFCPAPWSHLYYQVNSPSPCHLIRNNHLDMTPDEYFNSDWLKRIKSDMSEGRVPSSCSTCKGKEDLGLKSTRGALWGYYNVGPEPEYEDMWFANKFNVDTPTQPRRIELRFSNLCNMKCRHCDETSSSEWALEKKEHNLPPHTHNNTGGQLNTNATPLLRITKDKIAGLKNLKNLKNLKRVCLTGGEPLIIKEYYDYLDFLIENKLNESVQLEFFTNSSVYNPLFIDRLMKFQFVEMIMSVDGVGKVAEYIRHGMPWSTIETNMLKLVQLPAPIKPYVTVAISAYTLLDVSNLAKFLMKLYEHNNTIGIKCYTVNEWSMHFQNAPMHLKEKMILEIDKALEILTASNYNIFINELQNLKKTLLLKQTGYTYVFLEYTITLDKIRNENFEETFGLPLHAQKD